MAYMELPGCAAGFTYGAYTGTEGECDTLNVIIN